MVGDYQEEITFDSIYATKLFKEQMQKIVKKELLNTKYDKHISAIVTYYDINSSVANVSLSNTLSGTPVEIKNVKIRNGVDINVGDEVYLQAINGSLNNMFIDCTKSMKTNNATRLYSTINDSANITNTTEPLELYTSGSVIGWENIRPDTMRTGTAIRLTLYGTYSATPTIDLNLGIKISEDYIASVTFNEPTTIDAKFKIQALIVCRQDGISGKVIGQGEFCSINNPYLPLNSLGEINVNTTQWNNIKVMCQWSSASTSVGIKSIMGFAEMIA